MALMDPWILSVLLGFLALFGLLIYWMFYQERQRTRKQIDRAAALGFKPLPDPDPLLVNQILALHTRRAGQKLELRNLFHKHGLEADLYLFDLWDPTGEGSNLLAECAVAAVLPDCSASAVKPPCAAIPRLTLVPRLEGDGLLVRAANWTLSQLITGQQMIAFSDCPEFTARYFVAGTDETAVRCFLSPDLRRSVAALEHVQVEASGNLLTISQLEARSARDDVKTEKIRQQVNDAINLARMFNKN